MNSTAKPVKLEAEIQRALYGRRKGSRIRVAPAEERTADGIVFDSKHEMEVYLDFKPLVSRGTFKEMLLQVAYPVHVVSPAGEKIQVFEWVADFVITERDGRKVVYDAKGHRTEVYKLKKKCVEAEYGFQIVEV